MPLDSTTYLPLTTHLARCERLLEIAEATNAPQRSFCMCLFHEATSDPELIAAGIPQWESKWDDSRSGEWWVPSCEDLEALNDFFGLTYRMMTWTGLTIANKRDYLRAHIAKLRENG